MNNSNQLERKISKLAVASFICAITGIIFLLPTYLFPGLLFTQEQLFDIGGKIGLLGLTFLLIFAPLLGIVSIISIEKKKEELVGRWLADGALIIGFISWVGIFILLSLGSSI